MNENEHTLDGFDIAQKGIISDLESPHLTRADELGLQVLRGINGAIINVRNVYRQVEGLTSSGADVAIGIGKLGVSAANKAKGIVNRPLPGPPEIRQ